MEAAVLCSAKLPLAKMQLRMVNVRMSNEMHVDADGDVDVDTHADVGVDTREDAHGHVNCDFGGGDACGDACGRGRTCGCK